MAPKLNYVKFCIGIIILLVLYILYLLYKQKRVENFADTNISLPDYFTNLREVIKQSVEAAFGNAIYTTSIAVDNIPRPEPVEYIVSRLKKGNNVLLNYLSKNGTTPYDIAKTYLKIATNMTLTFENSIDAIINPPPPIQIENTPSMSPNMESILYPPKIAKPAYQYPPKIAKPAFQYTPQVGDPYSGTREITPLELPPIANPDVYN